MPTIMPTEFEAMALRLAIEKRDAAIRAAHAAMEPFLLAVFTAHDAHPPKGRTITISEDGRSISWPDTATGAPTALPAPAKAPKQK